jgi:hypothetical protein
MIIDRILATRVTQQAVTGLAGCVEKRVRVHARAALRRVNGYLKNMIEAIADSKLRRMERELELRGIHFDRPNNDWVTRDPARTSVRKD